MVSMVAARGQEERPGEEEAGSEVGVGLNGRGRRRGRRRGSEQRGKVGSAGEAESG